MTFEGEIFEKLSEARKTIIGSEDSFRYYNPKSGRPIKTANAINYEKVVLFVENHRLGYKGMTLLKKVPTGWMVTKEAFDQEGYTSFNDLWDLIKY